MVDALKAVPTPWHQRLRHGRARLAGVLDRPAGLCGPQCRGRPFPRTMMPSGTVTLTSCCSVTDWPRRRVSDGAGGPGTGGTAGIRPLTVSIPRTRHRRWRPPLGGLLPQRCGAGLRIAPFPGTDNEDRHGRAGGYNHPMCKPCRGPGIPTGIRKDWIQPPDGCCAPADLTAQGTGRSCRHPVAAQPSRARRRTPLMSSCELPCPIWGDGSLPWDHNQLAQLQDSGLCHGRPRAGGRFLLKQSGALLFDKVNERRPSALPLSRHVGRCAGPNSPRPPRLGSVHAITIDAETPVWVDNRSHTGSVALTGIELRNDPQAWRQSHGGCPHRVRAGSGTRHDGGIGELRTTHRTVVVVTPQTHNEMDRGHGWLSLPIDNSTQRGT